MRELSRAGEFDMIAKTYQGLESILQQELIALGAKEVELGRRMVFFRGDKQLMYQANIYLRTALRILVPIDQFEAQNADEVYQYLYEHIQWDQYIGLKHTYAFDTVVYSEKFTHSKFVAYRAKDALHDFFYDKKVARIPNVSVVAPDIRFHIHIADDKVTLALDSSGESLHRRGYRVSQNEAPISEVLAAGILLKAGWKGQSAFLDPMCGSGTFLTEAALIALGIPPGIFRQAYAFEKWPDFDKEMLTNLLEAWEEQPFEHKIYGSDMNAKAIAISRGNIKNAGLQKYVELSVKCFEEYTEKKRPADTGLIVMNPPYGERIRPMDLEKIYSNIGSTLKHSFSGWRAWIISGSIEVGFNAIALKHETREELKNGSIDCELRSYELFRGKRDEHLEALAEMGVLEELRKEREQYIKERDQLAQARKAYKMERRRSEEREQNKHRAKGDRSYPSKREYRSREHDTKEYDSGNRAGSHNETRTPFSQHPNRADVDKDHQERGEQRRRRRMSDYHQEDNHRVFRSTPTKKPFIPRDVSERHPSSEE